MEFLLNFLLIISLILLFKLLYLLLLIFVSFIVFQLIRRKFLNNKYDKRLNIETQGFIKFKGNSLYNRTESTPYLALEDFANQYEVSSSDKMVDFGSGKGRVPLFLSEKLNIHIKGIEANKEVLNNAITNLKNTSTEIVTFEYDYAEKYEVNEKENLFFFFNPFHVDIFKQVVSNIKNNADKYDKEVEIILYYPTKTYKSFLNKETDFKLVQKVSPKGSIIPKEQFLIYRYNKKKSKQKTYF